MKLNLPFLLTDVLVLLAYPIVYLHGRLHQYLKPAKLLVIVYATPARSSSDRF